MTLQQLFALSPILIVGLTVVTVMLAIAIKRHHKWTATISTAGLSLALVPLLVHCWLPGSSAFTSPQTVTPLLRIENYACFYMAMILIAALATTTLSRRYMEGYQGNREELYLLLLLSTLGGLVLVASCHFASLFIGLELLSVPMYGMAAYLVKERRSLEAGMKYLVLSAVASAFIVFGMALVYSQTGTLMFSEIGASVANVADDERVVMILGGAMLLIGIGF
jgi:NADH-quinone oxidoreductase subunit N